MHPSTATSLDNAASAAVSTSSTKEALQNSLAMLQQVVDRLPQAIGWKDKNAVFMGCNQAFARAVGFDHPAEIMGQVASEMQWYGQPAAFLHDCHLIDQQPAKYHQFELPQTQQSIWLDISQMPLYDEHGAVEGMLTMVEDVTDRKQAEAALRQSETTNRALINAVPDLLFRIHRDETYLDIQSSQDFKVLNPDQLMPGTRVSNSLPPAVAQQRMHYVQEALRTGELQIYEQELVLDGVTKYEEVRIVPCQENEVMAMVRDITDRKQAQKDLQLAQFSIEYTADSILWLRPNAQIIYANRAACQSLGYTAEELRSLTIFDIDVAFPPADWAAHWQQLKQQGSLTLESTHQASDGRVYPVEIIVSFFAFEGEEYNFVRACDITERKQAEAALKLSQFSIDYAADAIWWVESDGTIAYINDAGCHDLGLPREDILGKYVFDFNPDFPAEAWADHWQETRQKGSFTIETLNRRSDGLTYPVEVTINYMAFDGKEYHCAFVRNITERKRSEDTLRESERQMRERANREQLLNRLLSRIRNSLDFHTILETTLQEVQNVVAVDRCQFSWYNPNCEENCWEVVKETRSAELPSLVDRYPVSPASPLLVELLNLQILRVEDAETLPESSLLRFMRRFNYRSMLAIPIRMQSGLLGTIFCCHSTETRSWSDSDIELIQTVIAQLAIALTQAELYTQSRTKAQEVEQALRELQQTQTQMVQSEKMSSLGQLVAGVAHEINNPVNFIYGNLTHASSYTQDLLRLINLYQQHYPNPVSDIQSEAAAIDLDFLLDDLPKLLNSMKVGADRIQKIVLSLRNFSRMDEAEVKHVDLHEGLDSTLMILQSRLKDKVGQSGIAIVKQYGPLSPVECYPGQLNQVFMNILANAIDALEESGFDVSDRQPTIRIQTEQLHNGYIAIKIADNGCGMTQAQQQRLFDPFFTTKPIGKGTGLGLSISYQIVVKKHGGSLTCFSAQGEGTEFCIEIPAERL